MVQLILNLQEVGEYLSMPVSDATLNKFSDGEISVQITESVRGQDVFIIQPTCAPTNDNLMELLIMVDAKDQVQTNFKCCYPILWLCKTR